VIDFCGKEPNKDATRFQRQRVVVFAPSGTGQINDDPSVLQVQGARLVRDIFTARLPLQRFDNVVTELPAANSWTSSESLSLDSAESYVRQPRDQGDPARTSRLDDERKLVAYSLPCTDYVVAPAITTHETKWENQKVQSKQGAKMVKVLSIKLGGTLAIFKRDGAQFKRIALIEASVPSLVDTMSDTAAMATALDVKVGGVDVLSAAMSIPKLPNYISAVPDAGCIAEKLGKEGVRALLDCAKGTGTVDQALGNLDERLGSVCRESRGNPSDAQLAAQCEVRARAFQLARSFQKEARSVEGWTLFGLLAKSEDDVPSMSLGREEGLKVGYSFQARDAEGNLVAFYKVTDVGAGGENAEHTSPSLLNLRAGEAPTGARLEEYPQLGLVVTPFASIAMLALNDGAATVGVTGNTAQITLPSVVYGGGVDFGWDLSGLLGWTETFARVDAGVFSGAGIGAQSLLIPIDIWFEKGFYLGPILTLVGALGPSLQLTNLTVLAPNVMSTFPSDLHLSATQYGAAARLGLDFYLGPDWALRSQLFARVPMTPASYSESDNKPMQGFDQRNDLNATVGLNIGITKSF
jgi:hypothetical protein